MACAKLPVRDLAQTLVRKAGLSGEIERISLFPGGWTNRNWLVTLTSDVRCVLRQYQWPHNAPEPRRMEKEVYLHRLLEVAGVPVARVLGRFSDSDADVLLLEYLPGEILGDVTGTLSALERDAAWRSCGQALRKAHQITFGADEHGVIVGDRVEPAVPETWGHWRMHNLLHHAQALQEVHGLPIPVDGLASILEGALPLFNTFDACLLHNDAHVWNAVVNKTTRGWSCAGWLDWEYAWVGDPNWDLARADVWRIRDIGPTPESFWEGYGGPPVEPHFTFHKMSLSLWQANEHLSDPIEDPSPSHLRAVKYVAEFDRHLLQLRHRIDGGLI